MRVISVIAAIGTILNCIAALVVSEPWISGAFAVLAVAWCGLYQLIEQRQR